MIVRLLLGVVVAAALLAAAMPVVEDARHDARVATADRTVGAVADAIGDLRRSSDPVPRGVPGAQRVVSVDVPPGATVTIGTNATANVTRHEVRAVSYRVAPGTTGRAILDGPVRVVAGDIVRPPGDGLVLRESRRVVLRYELVDDDPVVTVERV